MVVKQREYGRWVRRLSGLPNLIRERGQTSDHLMEGQLGHSFVLVPTMQS